MDRPIDPAEPEASGPKPKHQPTPKTKPLTEVGGSNLADHIFHASAVMIGVCLTAISVIKLLESGKAIDTLADELLAGDGLLFMTSAVVSYVSMRLPSQAKTLQAVADGVFLLGLFGMSAPLPSHGGARSPRQTEAVGRQS